MREEAEPPATRPRLRPQDAFGSRTRHAARLWLPKSAAVSAADNPRGRVVQVFGPACRARRRGRSDANLIRSGRDEVHARISPFTKGLFGIGDTEVYVFLYPKRPVVYDNVSMVKAAIVVSMPWKSVSPKSLRLSPKTLKSMIPETASTSAVWTYSNRVRVRSSRFVRPQRWRDAVAELVALQNEYQAQ